MRVALVSQYFRPEPGATQNRMGAFADGLAARGHELTVICEQPNHPAGVFHPGYGRRPLVTEHGPAQTVHRVWVAASPRKTTARRLAFYGTFAAGAAAAMLTIRRPDVLLATSPPMPGALAACAAARARRVPFVVDVRDLWPAVAVALDELSNPRVVRAFERAERWLYRSAGRVTATTLSFCRDIDTTAGAPVSVYLPNGALDELLDVAPLPSQPRRPFVVGYAGNFGIAQGLRIVLEAADALRDDDVAFVLVGDGPLKSELAAERERRGLDNVQIRPAVPVAEVGAVLESFDAMLVPLGSHPMLDAFIPSKLYDAMAAGRPAIVAAGGEAAALTRETRCGLVIAPEDGAALAGAVRTLIDDPALAAGLGAAGREAASAHVRSAQIAKLEAILQECARGVPSGSSA